MQGDGCDAGVLGDAARLEVGQVVRVDALAHLDGQRHVARRADGAGDDVAEELALPRQGGSAALAGDLRDGASEVQIDVVGPVLGHEDAHGLGDRRGSTP